MDIVVSNVSTEPIYRQIYDQISRQILRGDLRSDQCLPSIRTVALELRISVITIKKAWEELEREGFLYTVAGKGCFVAPLPSARREDKRWELASDKMRQDVDFYQKLGLTRAEFIALAERHYPTEDGK